MTNKNYILIDFSFENEENKNNKLVNYYLKIFISAIEIFKKEIVQKVKRKYNIFYSNYFKKIYQ